MTVSAFVYGQAALGLGTGAFNFGTDTVKVMLTTSTYTPNSGADTFKSDVTDEVTDSSYTAGGKTLTSVTWAWDGVNAWAALNADAVTWTAAGFTMRYAVVYKSTGTDGTSPLLLCVDFGTDQAGGGLDFTLDWATGLLRAMPVS